jgi:hypothetical protein
MSSTASRPTRQRRERRRPAHEVEQLVDVPVVERAHRRRSAGRARRAGCAGYPQRLDLAGPHALDDHGGLHEVAAVLGEQHAALTAPTWWPARPTAAARWPRRRRLDLDHEVDRAHVDAELEAAGRDDRRQPPALRSSSMSARCSLLTRAVVGAGEHGGAPRRLPAAPSPRPAAAAARASAGRRSAPRDISLSRAVSRSASRRELANTIVERCASIRSTMRSSTCGQIEARRLARRPAR